MGWSSEQLVGELLMGQSSVFWVHHGLGKGGLKGVGVWWPMLSQIV